MSQPQPETASQPDAAEQLARLNRLFGQQQQAFAREPMPSLEERRQHLRTLKALLLEHREAIAEAINADFTARSPTETLLAEIIPCIEQVDYVLKRLKRWMRPSRRHVNLQFQPASARVVYSSSWRIWRVASNPSITGM